MTDTLIKGKDGEEYQVRLPESSDYKKAQMEYNRAFGDAIKSGAVLRAKLNEYMNDQKIWSEARQERIKKLAKDINDADIKLSKGGIKLNEAIKLAIQMKKDRKDFEELATELSTSDSNTAEGQAENARFQRLLSLCLVYKSNGQPVFDSVDSLLNEKDEDKVEILSKAFDILGKLLYKLDDTYESNYPENRFLKEWGRLDDKLRLRDEKGRLINEDNQLIDEKGRLINEAGELINYNNDIVDDEGNVKITKVAVFLDDDGNPIEPPKKVN